MELVLRLLLASSPSFSQTRAPTKKPIVCDTTPSPHSLNLLPLRFFSIGLSFLFRLCESHPKPQKLQAPGPRRALLYSDKQADLIQTYRNVCRSVTRWNRRLSAVAFARRPKNPGSIPETLLAPA